MYTDTSLTCVDCQAQFTFTAGEQEFHASKGFTNKPSRCPDCRAARKRNQGQGGSDSNRGAFNSYAREMHPATCAECGKQTEVPFAPTGSRPVYCRDCFSRQGGGGGGGNRRGGGGGGYGGRDRY